MRMITLVESDETNELIAVGISIPSIVRALQKSRGKLFPFGWFHILKSLKWKHEDGVELLLIAVLPEYQGKGINSLLFNDLIPVYQKMGFKWAETNPQLEENTKGLAQWTYLNPEIPKRRRCYTKPL
ncbi:MAG: GNAT family N-acetyltransferase, partial [Bacteroidaceae bacterium]|nr:GNAT family N-acetyltransferase [Bacteroidaceae bacterium]